MQSSASPVQPSEMQSRQVALPSNAGAEGSSTSAVKYKCSHIHVQLSSSQVYVQCSQVQCSAINLKYSQVWCFQVQVQSSTIAASANTGKCKCIEVQVHCNQIQVQVNCSQVQVQSNASAIMYKCSSVQIQSGLSPMQSSGNKEAFSTTSVKCKCTQV